MFPILRKLSHVRSKAEIADLLQRHIGNGSNQTHCKHAFEALQQRVHINEVNETAEVIMQICLISEDHWCSVVRTIIDNLSSSPR